MHDMISPIALSILPFSDNKIRYTDKIKQLQDIQDGIEKWPEGKSIMSNSTELIQGDCWCSGIDIMMTLILD